jgi:hypothetical protein
MRFSVSSVSVVFCFVSDFFLLKNEKNFFFSLIISSFFSHRRAFSNPVSALDSIFAQSVFNSIESSCIVSELGV